MSYLFYWLNYLDSGTLALLNIALLPLHAVSWKSYDDDKIVNLADIFSLIIVIFDIYVIHSYLKITVDEFYTLLILLFLINIESLIVLFVFFCKIYLYTVDFLKAHCKKSNRTNNKWWNSLTEEEKQRIKDTMLLRSTGGKI